MSGSMVLYRLSGVRGLYVRCLPQTHPPYSSATNLDHGEFKTQASSIMASEHAQPPPNRSFALSGGHTNCESITLPSGDAIILLDSKYLIFPSPSYA